MIDLLLVSALALQVPPNLASSHAVQGANHIGLDALGLLLTSHERHILFEGQFNASFGEALFVGFKKCPDI